MFLGGDRYPGDNTDAILIAKEGGSEGKVLAAMGHAAFTLIKADLLKGKKIATNLDNFWVQKAGATKCSAPVERDGMIITGTYGRPETVPQQFAEKIAAALAGGSQ